MKRPAPFLRPMALALSAFAFSAIALPAGAMAGATAPNTLVQPAPLDAFTGRYARFAGSPQVLVVEAKDGRLVATDPRGIATVLARTAANPLEFIGGDRKVVFSTAEGANGEISAMVLSSGTQSVRFEREAALEAEYRQTAGQARPHAVSDAVLMNDLASLKKLIEAGADLEELDTRVERAGRNGRRPLNWAAIRNHTEVMELLLSAGADLNLTNRSGYTPLHHAAEAGSLEAAELLLAQGADPQRKTLRGHTALDVAMSRSRRGLIERLQKAVDEQECGNDGCAPATLESTSYQQPEDPGDGLPSVSLEQAGADQSLLAGLLARLDRAAYHSVDSLLVVKDGKLVIEQYYSDWNRDRAHMMQSVSKSITALLIGSALHQGLLESVEQPIASLLPNHTELLTGDKAEITIEDLLTMSAGFDWNEADPPYGHPRNIRGKEVMSKDPVTFTLSTDFIHEPGEVFTYSGGYVTIVGVLLEKLFGTDSVRDALDKSSLSKLQFENFTWLQQAGGFDNTAGGVLMRPRDLAKIGQLMLNGGTWQGERLLSEDFVQASLAHHVSTSTGWDEYGYFWWGRSLSTDRGTYEVDAARGWGGQELVLVKDLNLVVVMTATNYQTPTPLEGILTTSILPAFE